MSASFFIIYRAKALIIQISLAMGKLVVNLGKEDTEMKIGFRTPSLKKRISARTSIKRQAVHRAGLKMPRGYGWVRNPKKYAYNKVYQRTSFDIFSSLKKLFMGSK